MKSGDGVADIERSEGRNPGGSEVREVLVDKDIKMMAVEVEELNWTAYDSRLVVVCLYNMHITPIFIHMHMPARRKNDTVS